MRNGSIVGLFFCLLAILASAQAQNPPIAAPRDPVLVTISEKTTRITAPLKESGYPDFLEAANIAAKGKVTPETNGAVLLVRAAGPYGVSPGEQQAEFYKRLEIEPLPENQRKHVFHADFVYQLQESELPPPTAEEKMLEYDNERIESRRSRVELDFDYCGEHPWTAKEFPLVARWLREQKQSLAQLDRLREYPSAYLPQLTGLNQPSLVGSELPLIQFIRHFSLDLRIRAMHALAEGQHDAAIDDLERMFILSGYLRQGQNLVSLLVGFAVHGFMQPLVNELVFSTQLQPQQLERIQNLIEKHFPVKATYADTIDQGERLFLIEAVCRYAEFGPGGDEKKPLPLKTRQNLDYDLILKVCNAHYDRLVGIARLEDPEKQKQAISELDTELGELSKKNKSAVNAVLNFLSKDKRSEQVANILMALLTPALNAAEHAGMKNSMRRELWLLSIALEQYRRQHGQFPKSVEELAPQYIAKIPVDRFTGKSLIYQANRKSVLVYSVGHDLEDHHGYEGDDTDRNYCDDIAIFTNDRRPKQSASKPPREFFD